MLSVSDLVNVTISLSQLSAVARSFNILMIAGDSGVISGKERFRTYTNVNDVASDFGTTAPEYLAANLYFQQKPQPSTLMIGAWLRVATAGANQGAILTAAQQMLSNFTPISNGSFVIPINGTSQNVTGLNFNGVTNLNAVASIINGVLTGAICTWTGQQFVITSNLAGAGIQASGSITFTGAGTAADTITLGGTSIELVASAPTGNQVLIGPNAAGTAGNLYTFLANSSDTNLSECTYALNGDVVSVTYKTIGVAGNSFSLAKSSSAVTLSGATLTGGAAASSVGYATTYSSGTDVSTLLGLTASTSLVLVPGYAAETPVQCATALTSASAAWYGLHFAASTMPTDNQNLQVSDFIEALTVTRMFGVTIQDTAVLSSLSTTDLGYLMKQAGYDQSFSQYSSTNPYAAVSLFGRAFGVDFTAANSTINLMWKQEPGVLAETSLTEDQAATLKAKFVNVYAGYNNNTTLVQYGRMASGQKIDTIQGADWFQNDVQTQLFNVLYTTDKVDQTNPGVNKLTNAAAQGCIDAVFNGFSAPGQWNGPVVGSLQTGQYLKSGYYVFAEDISSQSQADRDENISPPILVALKLAGDIDTVPNVLLTINQ